MRLAATSLWTLSNAQLAIEAVATLAFALSGLIEAARKRLDAVGVCVVAGLAAFGGGTLRDVLLDRRPFFWVQHAAWLWVLLALCIGAMLFMRARHVEPTERAMQWPDALGLGLFTAGGTQIALDVSTARDRRCPDGHGHRGVRRCPARHRLQRDSEGLSRPSALCRLLVRGWLAGRARARLGRAAMGRTGRGAGSATLLRALALLSGWTLPAWRSMGSGRR